jgi:hypothetical protein
MLFPTGGICGAAQGLRFVPRVRPVAQQFARNNSPFIPENWLRMKRIDQDIF